MSQCSAAPLPPQPGQPGGPAPPGPTQTAPPPPPHMTTTPTTTTTTTTTTDASGTQQQTSTQALIITLLNGLPAYRDRGRLQNDTEIALAERGKWTLTPSVVQWGDSPWFRLEGEILTTRIRTPIHLWLPAEYPAGYPLLFVVPGKHSRLTLNHPHVGSDGRCYLEAISQWNPNTSSIKSLLESTYTLFLEKPAVDDTSFEDTAAVIQKNIKKGIKGAMALAGKLAQDTKQYVQQHAHNQHQPGQQNPPAKNPTEGGLSADDDPKKWDDTIATEPGTECAICMENKKCAFFLPCGHVVCCMTCSKNLKECCICRSAIQGVHKAYL
eukprot:TRINITY_DN2188_c0_g1_i1.p1 TRINITY_DN2188_c0_g1~~TRINITY_DN2188_c0_g1_i1.p1  ORF type:complete len:325 (+),score=49.22 TRINITY_DN2188_c0_g1_i1:33-1007(+)